MFSKIEKEALAAYDRFLKGEASVEEIKHYKKLLEQEYKEICRRQYINGHDI